jgi:hypothetical protein
MVIPILRKAVVMKSSSHVGSNWKTGNRYQSIFVNKDYILYYSGYIIIIIPWVNQYIKLIPQRKEILQEIYESLWTYM